LLLKTETISSKIRNEARVSTLPTPSQHSTGIPSQSSKKKKEIQGIQIRGKEVKLFLFADKMRLRLKDPKN
jgi:hypothetical protein